MARLKTSMNALLTPDILQSLFNKKVFTVHDYLEMDPKMVTKVTSLTFKETLDIRKQLLRDYSAKIIVGSDYYTKLLEQTALTATHIKSFDELIDGGLFSGAIYELRGTSATGKTLMCCTIALNVCEHYATCVYYIDTKGDLSAVRLRAILEAKNCTKDTSAAILTRLKVMQTKNPYELISALYTIRNELESNDKKCSLIVIDSLSSVFYQNINYDRQLMNLTHIVNAMRYISNEFQISFLLTNNLLKHAYWDRIPSTTIQLTKADANCCKLNIVKSNAIECNKNCEVTITNAGII